MLLNFLTVLVPPERQLGCHLVCPSYSLDFIATKIDACLILYHLQMNGVLWHKNAVKGTNNNGSIDCFAQYFTDEISCIQSNLDCKLTVMVSGGARTSTNPIVWDSVFSLKLWTDSWKCAAYHPLV